MLNVPSGISIGSVVFAQLTVGLFPTHSQTVGHTYGQTTLRATSIYHISVGICDAAHNSANYKSHPEMVGDMSRVTLNFYLSKIPFVHF